MVSRSKATGGDHPAPNEPTEPPASLWLWWSHEPEHEPRWWVMRDPPPEGRISREYVLVAAKGDPIQWPPSANCPDCEGTGLRDSGGVQPWGDAIHVACDCGSNPASPPEAP